MTATTASATTAKASADKLKFFRLAFGAAMLAALRDMRDSLAGIVGEVRSGSDAITTAATQMTAGLMPEAVLAALKPEAVSPVLLHLVGEDAPTRAIACAGAGTFERAYVTLTPGVRSVKVFWLRVRSSVATPLR